MQGRIFEESLLKEGCSSSIFIRRFMNSRFVTRMDKLTFINESTTIDEIFKELDDEYGKSNYGKIKFSNEEMYWMGYIYRYWHFYTGENSREIYKQAPAKTMNVVYLMYHTMSPEMAMDRLKEAYEKNQ